MDRVYKELVINLLLGIFYRTSNFRLDSHVRNFESTKKACEAVVDALKYECESCKGQLPNNENMFCSKCGRRL